MIGVVVPVEDLEIAGELFELFKTPWEPAVAGRTYDAILSTCGRPENLDADLVLMFGSGATDLDRTAGIEVTPATGTLVEWDGRVFPIYGRAAIFRTKLPGTLTTRDGGLDYVLIEGRRRQLRVGYDLLGEIRQLLTLGQPVEYASSPTLEIHISLLRQWLVWAGVPFVELLPRPAEHEFICCLTHDVDFIGLRRHFVDHTLVGFVLRASFGTTLDVVRGRRPAADMLRNFGAVCALPFVVLGIARDFWRPFADYAEFDGHRPSTFFVIPFRDRPGRGPMGEIDRRRAVRYDVTEIAHEVKAAEERGNEVGVHGIDAWRDRDAACTELRRVSSVVSKGPGIRMHWLYWCDESPMHLEAAGAAYDATWGYNNAAGYRAGTSQVFQLPGTRGLLELPLSVMDSALLSAGRMAMDQRCALAECRRILSQARRLGGTLVINWHCRSLAPERLWDSLYRQLLDDLDGCNPWYATAREAVEWFRWRRGVQFSEVRTPGRRSVRACTPGRTAKRGVLRVYRGGTPGLPEEIAFDGTATELTLATARA